jgi:hypothetical protein
MVMMDLTRGKAYEALNLLVNECHGTDVTALGTSFTATEVIHVLMNMRSRQGGQT